MRKLLILATFFFASCAHAQVMQQAIVNTPKPSGGSSSTIAYVTSASNDGGGTSYAITISISAGDVVVVAATDDESTVSSISGCGTFTSLISSSNTEEMWGTLSASACSTLTVNWAATNHGAASVWVGTCSPGPCHFGNTATNSGTTAAMTVSNTLTYANDFMVSGFDNTNTGGTCTSSTGNVRQCAYNNNQSSRTTTLMDNTSSSTGSLTTATTTVAAQWYAGSVEIENH